MLLPAPAAAQKSLFVDGFTELTRAMLAVPAESSRVTAAIDTMAAGLDRWDTGSADRSIGALIGDEAADTPMLPLAAYAEGFSQIGRGEYREAIAAFRRAAAVTTDERAQLAAAGHLAQQGRDLEAERALRAIAGTFPASGVAHWWLARVYERLNRISDARREYETVVAMALTGRAPLYAAIGRLALAQGDVARATEALEQRLRLTPNDPVAHRELAQIYLQQDRTDRALAGFSAAIALNPRDAEAHAAIGRIRLDAGLPADAIPPLRHALELKPALYEARYALALALKQAGRHAEAARELELYERGRQQATEDRRRAMAAEARRQEAARQDPR
jgi:tetratricopeptide (TPR) repeat protein